MTTTTSGAGAAAAPFRAAAPAAEPARTVLPRGHRYAGDLRAELLAAALDLVTERGVDALTIRAVAARVGVSHAAPARWYPTKGHLLTAVATEAFNLLVARTEQARRQAASRAAQGAATDHAGSGSTADPAGVLLSCAQAYLDFAAAHPGHFAVMWREDLLLDDPALTAAGEASSAQLTAVVHQAAERGWARGRDLDAVADLLWSSVHGMAVLRVTGPYRSLTESGFTARARTAVLTLTDALA